MCAGWEWVWRRGATSAAEGGGVARRVAYTWCHVSESQLPPKVFISHASADKARFVTGLAEKLRANGVDAWLDSWEMQPGDYYLRVGYQWAPYKDVNQSGFAPYRRFTTYPAQKILGMDTALSKSAHAHIATGGFNRLFADGHVAYGIDPEATDLIYTGGPGLWLTFDPIIDLLERP